MSLHDNRICIFCGNKPNETTREHVVPYWALEYTGDPRRVVTFGHNYKTGKSISYSWSSFVAPACDTCNGRYSKLEEDAKDAVLLLSARKPLLVSQYITLMDWLDKVRVGSWLLRHMIEKHPASLKPNFYIDSRIAQKDRMVAVYFFDKGRGINLLGTDSMIFGDMPSCFGMRINDILLLNASTDFFCSAGCGLPHPTSITFLNDMARIRLDGIGYSKDVSNPITPIRLCKPAAWLYQPIRLPSEDKAFSGGYYGHTNLHDSRITSRTFSHDERQAALFQQKPGMVEIHRNKHHQVEFDEVKGADITPFFEIAATVYDTQIYLHNFISYDGGDASYRSERLENTNHFATLYRAQRVSK